MTPTRTGTCDTHAGTCDKGTPLALLEDGVSCWQTDVRSIMTSSPSRPEDRQPYPADWLKTSSSSRGWGMFELVDMCNALGILPIVDMRLTETTADMADLVDYLYGDASTVWGAKRILSGQCDNSVPLPPPVYPSISSRTVLSCYLYADVCAVMMSSRAQATLSRST